MASIVLMLFSILAGLFHGGGFLSFINLIARTILGESALNGGVTPLLVVLIFHLFIQAIWGMTFALMTQKIHSKDPLGFKRGLSFRQKSRDKKGGK